MTGQEAQKLHEQLEELESRYQAQAAAAEARGDEYGSGRGNGLRFAATQLRRLLWESEEGS
jgi:hypothetical protein